MDPRRTLLATSLAFGLLAAGQADAADPYRMDGTKRRSMTYEGVLSQPAAGLTLDATRDPVTPSLEDCTEQSCDIREFALTLPKGTTWGKFHVTVVLPRTIGAALVLYDAKDNLVASDDVLVRGSLTTGDDPASYLLVIDQRRMKAGRYTLAVVDRAGEGAFQASIGWTAHPPDRRR